MSKPKPPASDELPLGDWNLAVDVWDASIGGLTDLSPPASVVAKTEVDRGPQTPDAADIGGLPTTHNEASDSGVVVIPNLEELSASVLDARSPQPDPAAVLPADNEATEISATQNASDSTEPLAHFTVRPEEVLLVQDVVLADNFDPFAGPAPASEDVLLSVAPSREPRRLDGFVGVVDWATVQAPTAGPTEQYKEERLALLADELEARQVQGSSGEDLAWVALEAARAASMAGAAESVQRLIDRACAAAPDAVAPRRERLRLLGPGEPNGAALAQRLAALVSDVSDRAGEQSEAYATLARALRAAAGQNQRSAVVGAPDPGLALLAAAAQLGGDDVRHAPEELEVAGRALSGVVGAQLLHTAARMLELHASADRGAALRQAAHAVHSSSPSTLMATLRMAGTFSPGDTLSALQAALREIDDETLKGAVGRWASSLAEIQGDPVMAAELLSLVVDGKPLPDLRVAERICLLSLHLTDLIDNPEGWVEGLSPEDSALLLAVGAEMAVRVPREIDAMELLDKALTAAPDGGFAALLAERLCHSVAEPKARVRGLSLWAKGDAARTGMALLELCGEIAATTGSVGNDEQVIAAQNAALAALPKDAAFLSFAWNDISHRRYGSAAQRFERGAAAFEALGEPELAAAFRERSEDALVAEVPTRAVVRAMARSSSAEESLDHPRVLALSPLEEGRAPATVASAYRSAAMASREVSVRVLEAASWMKAAGQRREAISFLHTRGGQAKPAPSTAMIMRILTNTYEDPEAAANVFERLAAAAGSDDQRGFFLCRRAEALCALGRFGQAAEVLSEVASGPLAAEALVGYRRMLWTAGSSSALDGLLRDEADGYRGVGQHEKAAAVLMERSFVQASGLAEPSAALAFAQEALELDRRNTAYAVQTFVMAASQRHAGGIAQAQTCLADAGDVDAMLLALLAAESNLDHTGAGAWLKQAQAANPQRMAFVARQFDPQQRSGAWFQLADAVGVRVDGDPRLPQQLKLRGAESLAREGDILGAKARLSEIVAQDPRDFAALRLQARVARSATDSETLLAATVAAASAATMPIHRSQLYLSAALQVGLGDARAEAWLRTALTEDPGNTEVFSHLRGIVEARKDLPGLAELIRVHQQSGLNKDDAESLRFERASLLAQSGDRSGAKAELRTVLLRDPQNARALRELVELEYQDGAYSIAAEMYLRLARLEDSAQNQIKIFRRLGRIYHRRLADPKLAAGAFERVLKLDADDLDALTGLSEIYSKQNDVQRAIAATERAVAIETDDKRRLGLQLRLAGLYEKNADVRKAGALLRRAHEQAPRSLQAIGELARYLERHKDAQGRRVLLDTSLSRLHEDLRRFPGDLSALRVIVPVLRWCSRAAGSAASAQLLAALSPDDVERRELQAWASAPAKTRRLSPLLNPEVDEMAYPSRLPPGLRQVMRVLGPPLSKASRPDLRRFGVVRPARVGVGEGPRVIIDALAVDLGVRGFEVFVTSEIPHALLVEPGDPPAIVLGAALVSRGPLALRFAAGYALRLVSTHFDLLAAKDPGPEALLTALVRQFLNLPVDGGRVDEAAIAQVLPRLNKALGRSKRSELRPFVAEMASPESLANVGQSVEETAARVGLLAAGDLAIAVEVLLAAGGQELSAANLAASPVASALFEFALSADYELLVRAIDSVS